MVPFLQPMRASPAAHRVRPAASRATRHYGTLDALRGVAAVAVLLLHTREQFWPGLARSAYLAVDFFFILSGFVVAHAYDARLGQGLSPAAFVRLRALRLYPLHLAGLLIGALVAVGSGVPAGGVLLGLGAAALFLPAPFGAPGGVLFPLNPPAWSLFFEVVANVAYGLAHRWLSWPVLVATVGLSGLALCGQAAVAGTIDSGATWSSIHGGFARVAFGFGAGVLLHRCRDRIPPGLGRMGPWPLLTAMFALCLPTMPAPWRPFYDLAVVGVAAPLLVAAGSRAAPSPAAGPAFAALGLVSFPLYALHEPVMGPMVAAAEGLGLAPAAAGLAYLAGILAIAWAAAPLDAAVRRRLGGRRG